MTVYSVSTISWAGASYKARPRHRRLQLPCGLTFTDWQHVVRDLRHLDAKAASHLNDYLTWLDGENKAQKTIYGYSREIANLLRAHPDKRFDEFTQFDINEQIVAKPRRSRFITRSIYNGWFAWGEMQELIDRNRNPMLKVVKPPQPPRRPPDRFEEAERQALEALPCPRSSRSSTTRAAAAKAKTGSSPSPPESSKPSPTST